MKDQKAEVLDMKIESGMCLRVTFPAREDRDLFVSVTRQLSAPGTVFELVSDTEILCKPPVGRYG